jgi:hypothetical protein
MSGSSLQMDHPIDALPAYVRGTAADRAGIERHLAGCAVCRDEVEILRALADEGPAPLSDVERHRVYRAFEARRTEGSAEAPTVGAPSPSLPRRQSWIAPVWRIAAGVTLILTGAGVWQALQPGGSAQDWNPDVAIEGWAEDLAELDVAAGDVRLAFGLSAVDDIVWDDLEGMDPAGLAAPWEDDR